MNENIASRYMNYQDVSKILKDIRIANLNRIIIGHINVNSFRNELDSMKNIIPGDIDDMVIGDSKLDDSYPTTHLLIEEFPEPYRFDRNSSGGGLLIYVRENMPSKQLFSHLIPPDIAGMFIWLMCVAYHPPSQKDDHFFKCIGRALDVYNDVYDKLLLVGDFNAEEKEPIISEFMDLIKFIKSCQR